MLKIKLLVVGTIKEKYFVDAINEYKKRLSRFVDVEIQEVAECGKLSKTSIEEIKRVEGVEILKNLNGFVVALDKGGVQLDSEGFAKLISDASVQGSSKITFIIGGSHGLDNEVLNKVNKKLSFGKVTYPHQLMRVILLEQIYRAETILNNITYHK